jgi:hypothetical protein
MMVAEYVGRMHSLGDDMATAGRILDDDELVECILTGLDEEYDSLVSLVLVRVDPISVGELYSQMLAFETRIKLRNKNNRSGSSTNATSHGCGRGGPRRLGYGGNQGGRGSNSLAQCGGCGRFNPRQAGCGGNNGGPSKQPTCQVCHKVGHTVDRCWYKYDEGYTPDPRHAATTTNSYTVDTNWYTDTGATDHITGELEKLALRDKYNGGEQIHVANGVGMSISHVGEATIHTQNHNLKLNLVLHVPQASKNFIFVHRFTSYNNVFLEYHPYFFFIKDRATKKLLLKGRCHKGLYPLPISCTRQALGVSRSSLHRWHSQLGHPTVPIVQRVVSRFNLPCHDESNKGSVCDACQQAKSHQLPYPKSSSFSSYPLELVYSDV